MRVVAPSRPQIRWRWLAVALVALVLLSPASSPTVGAHDLRITHATLTFTPGRYQLDVVVDPESLLARLEIYGGRSPSAGVPAAEIPDRIRALGDVALARTAIAFNGVQASPTVQFLPAIAS